jgi:hypothetical protein
MKRLLLGAACLAAAPGFLHAQAHRPEKVSHRLWDLVTHQAAPAAASRSLPHAEATAATAENQVVPAAVPTEAQRVVISALAEESPEALAEQLAALGADHIAIAGRVVSARLPVARISHLPALDSLRFARPALAFTQAGLTTSQGDKAQYSDLARTATGATGAGVRVGILSDSFNNLGGMTAGKTSGDLPGDILILKDYTPAPGEAKRPDEGRAMAEIVHDVAPGATVAFHTAWYGEADFANGIRRLANAGCQVIVDDVLYLEEPMFADGIIAQAVNEVAARGVAYFSSAGNGARQSYEAPFVNAGGYHDFNPGTTTDTILNISLNNGSTYFVLQWPDRYASTAPGNPGAATDLDIELVNPDGTPVTYQNAAGQVVPLGGFTPNIGLDPVEVFGVSVNAFGVNCGLQIKLKQGPAPSRVKILWYSSGHVGQQEWNTASSTLYGHMNAAGAMAVGAARYCNTPAFGRTPPQMEYFSSAGGTAIYYLADGRPTYELREKPDFTAPDGGNTTFFGGGDYCGVTDSYPNFHGTSAAAPHAAGVAALMLQARPNTAPDRIRWLLQATAIDIYINTAPPKYVGFDYDSGYGLIDAKTAMTVLTLPPPALVAAASRKPHGKTDPKPDYDLPLALEGRPTVDGRIDSRLTLVFAFDRPILTATPRLVRGSAQFAGEAVIENDSSVVVELDGVADCQWLTVELADVLAADGSFLDATSVSVGILGGDVNNTAAVTGSDVYQLRLVTGALTSEANFPLDVDMSGSLSGMDVYAVRLRTGKALPPWSW